MSTSQSSSGQTEADELRKLFGKYAHYGHGGIGNQRCTSLDEQELDMLIKDLARYSHHQTTVVLDALQKVVNRAAPAGTQDGDFIGYYILPTGPIHAAIPVLQAAGRDAGTHNVPEAVEQYQADVDRQTEQARTTERKSFESIAFDACDAANLSGPDKRGVMKFVTEALRQKESK